MNETKQSPDGLHVTKFLTGSNQRFVSTVGLLQISIKHAHMFVIVVTVIMMLRLLEHETSIERVSCSVHLVTLLEARLWPGGGKFKCCSFVLVYI